MASLPVHGLQHLTRLTTAARLARMRPTVTIEVDAPGVLRTERLVIRALRWTDREGYIDAVRASRKEVDSFCPLHKGEELDDELFNRQLELGRAAEATGRAWRRIAEDRSQPGRIVGAVNLNDIAYGLEARAELSVWVRSDAAGHGFAGEAIEAVFAHAFAPRWPQRIDSQLVGTGLGLSRVDCLIAPDNHGCLKMSSRIGFVADDSRCPQSLVVKGRDVPHLPFVIYAPVPVKLEREPHVPAGVALAGSIESLLAIERRAATEV